MHHNLQDLNNPDTRQLILRSRLKSGIPLIATDIAIEMSISIDTVRRDLIALEKQGYIKRVKGGALAVNKPSTSLIHRLDQKSWLGDIRQKITTIIDETASIFLDGGASVLEFTHQLPFQYQGLIITPSPKVACITQELEIKTLLIGGTIRPLGGIATGADSVAQLAKCAADFCVIGTCGLDLNFGLSADEINEAEVKAKMIENAAHTILLANDSKFDTRSRHHVAPCNAIDTIITNANAKQCKPFLNLGTQIHYV